MTRKVRILLFIGVFVFGGILINQKYLTLYANYKLNWEFYVPKPLEINTVINTRYGFPNEGETYYVLEYSDQKTSKMKEQNDWKPINEKSIDTVSKLINNFQSDTININKNPKSDIQRTFHENPVEYSTNDKYFYRLEDNSYLLAILNVENQKIFVMEWIQ